MTKKKTLLRSADIAWQAFQAGAAIRGSNDIKHLNQCFNAWWCSHPQTLPNGGLKPAKAKP